METAEEGEGQEEEENPARPAADPAEQKGEQPELNQIWTCCGFPWAAWNEKNGE